jgi:2-dehydropantoate 2-reductase
MGLTAEGGCATSFAAQPEAAPPPASFTVVGCGAIGSLFGALLARAGHTVWMVDNHPQRARIIARQGLLVAGPDGSFHARVNATADPRRVPATDFVFIFVKAYATPAAAETVALIAGDAAVVTLQNGLGNVATLAERFGGERVLGGATAQGATEIGPGQVRHAGVGATVVAGSRAGELAGLLNDAGIETQVTNDLEGALWSKLVVNCGINAVGALTRLPNGGLAQDPSAVQILRAAVQEAAAVARAKGIRLAYDDPAGYTQEVCCASATNVNSMLQDVLRGRRTEVEFINGVVVREAQELGLEAPVNAALVALVGAIERNYALQIETPLPSRATSPDEAGLRSPRRRERVG